MISSYTPSPKKLRGFTIVELLVVIVVIAILAAISMVAYNGMQVRARNAIQISTAKAYMTAIKAYVAENGTYPYAATTYCLGVEEAQCSTASPGSYARNTAFDNLLKTIIDPLPTPAKNIPLSGSPVMAFMPFKSNPSSPPFLDGVNHGFFIYTLEPPGKCVVGDPASGPYPNMTSATATSGYSFMDGSSRVCYIPLQRL